MNEGTSPQPTAAATAAGYDRVAAEYAQHLYHELADKPFDRGFLDGLARSLPPGEVLDLGCGPGQVGRYLHDRGAAVRGLDLSAEMVKVAAGLNPRIEFHQGDMRGLPFADRSFAGVVAFYSIIHLGAGELAGVFREVWRVLVPGGRFALSFHVGQEVVHLDELWGIRTSLDFVFFQPEQVAAALGAAAFEELEIVERDPYAPPVEVQTRRCYVVARRPS
jgi:SAM-dependent methyltransferase